MRRYNIYVPNNRSSISMKKKFTEMKGEIENSMVMSGDSNIPLTIGDRITRQKISKKIENLIQCIK